ncbi:MAG: family 10 glycosylhydrolase [Prevotella sp.]|nr:family 10 glycosylhydrolase [Prevotella sp.]
MGKIRYSVMGCLALLMLSLTAQAQGKREFRGAWIQCVNGQFQGMGTERMQQTLAYQLDELQKDGVNAIMFQVRPECDALYESKLEPWSRFLTGRQGVAPAPYWDPLQWMIDECHKRGMELHAWINPYRAKTKTTGQLAANHIALRKPANCFAYDGQFILNPGIPENRNYICEVVKDIVTRYDVDGIHMDDYFYPYPVKGESIPDDRQFREHPNGIKDKGDWRRYNVNLFIEQLYKTVHAAKPWVKVGISPFGIYRNKKSSPIGSDTNGTQNYDDLYADVLLWVNNGWLDYCVPQVYWEIGNRAADYETLIRWWNQYAGQRPLFIGEDVERTVKFPDVKNPNVHQQAAKMALHRQLPYVKGTVLWYAKAAVDNVGNYGTNLRNVYWRYPALQPTMPFIDGKAPKKVRKVKPVWTEDGYVLFWTAPKGKGWKDEATKYVVYRFAPNEKPNLEDPSKIYAITGQTFLKLPYDNGKTRWVYHVTALDRLQNESKSVSKKVKL